VKVSEEELNKSRPKEKEAFIIPPSSSTSQLAFEKSWKNDKKQRKSKHKKGRKGKRG
jgi:hypothetical protein